MHKSSSIIQYKEYGYRLITLAASYVVGWILYMFGVLVFPYDGVISLVFQTLIGAVVSCVVVGVSWLIGTLVRTYIPKKYIPGYRIHVGIMVIVVALLFVINLLGVRGTYIDSEVGTTFSSINVYIGVIGYIFILFFITNWPIERKG